MNYNLYGEDDILEFAMWMISQYSIPGDEPEEGSVEFSMYEFFQKKSDDTLDEPE